MRRDMLLVSLLTAVLIAFPASAQTTRPADELAKENAELKKRIEQLEAYVAKLEAKLQPSKAKPAPGPRLEVRPFPRAPYGYELPSPPFKVPAPSPAPLPKLPDARRLPPTVVPDLPPQSVPENWKKREFNGMEFYLVPLE